MALLQAIIVLPFEGNNFSCGIVACGHLPLGKDTAYELLKKPCHNWCKFLLCLVIKVVSFFTLLTSDEREKVLIFNGRTYARSRSKAVELLAWIFDHTSGRTIKGFKLLTLRWSDGASFLPLICFVRDQDLIVM